MSVNLVSSSLTTMGVWWGTLALLLLCSVVHGNDGVCNLYLAKSTIPGAGWGVFTARGYKMGERIGNPTVGIPVQDISGKMASDSFGALEEFLWPSSDIGGFSEAMRVDLFLPGPASLVNHHSALDNVIAGGLTLEGDLLRETNPMAGSFSAYHAFTLIAKRDIQAGEELFADKTRNHQQATGIVSENLASADDYRRADEIVKSLDKELDTGLTDAQWIDVLYRIQSEVLEGSSKVARVLPSTLQELQKAREVGTARAQLEEWGLEWVLTNGICMDGIEEGTSNIENAGRGAFATQGFSKGAVVATSPMVQVTNGTSALENRGANKNGMAPSQLLMNYCFGHRHADLLLCPTTEAALMNHDAKRANVKIQWSSRKIGDSQRPYQARPLDDLKVSPHDLESHNTKLMFEFVALQDIQAGDELFLDYGSEWEDALSRHLHQDFEALNKDDSRSQLSAKQMNEKNGSLVPSDQMAEDNSYMYECLIYPNVEIRDGAGDWQEFSSSLAIDKNNWPETFRAWYGENDFAPWYPCVVKEGDERKGLYDIQMFVKPLANDRLGRQYRNVPRNRIRYAEQPYTSDQHLPWSFRHYIPIDDAIFPLRWRDDYRTGASVGLGTKSTVNVTAGLQDEYEKTLREVDCGLYLAASSIPNSGFGTYTAVDIPAGGLVIGSKLPAIHVFEPALKNYFWPGKDYIWTGALATYELFPDKITALFGLFGSLANAHTGIKNMDNKNEIWQPVLDRTRDPGAGAISDYVGSHFQSSHPVAAGEELFVTYGVNQWFTTRPEYQDAPLEENFDEADNLLAWVSAMVLQNGASLEPRSVELLMKFVREAVANRMSTRTKNALVPVQSVEDLIKVIGRNGTAQATVTPRNSDWLEENGFCLDHIYVDRSTNSQAGWGAFARRHLQNGTTIIAAPTLATVRDFMDWNVTGQEHQLFLNYHFGHKDSSMLFFPLNQAIAINHKSTRTSSYSSWWGGGNSGEPNARVQFSTKDRKTKYFLSRPLNDLKLQKHSTMVLEFVATRDIAPDEEIFVDYGAAWEEAWNEHVKNYENPCKKDGSGETSCFRSSKIVNDMNKDKTNKKYHKWSDTHMAACEYNTDPDEPEFHFLTEGNPLLVNGADPRFKQSFGGVNYHHEGYQVPKKIVSKQSPGSDATTIHKLYPCVVLGSTKDENYEDKFDVLYLLGDEDVPKAQLQGFTANIHVGLRVRDLPSNELTYVVKPMKSDMVAPGAFRHEIEIPDEIFPPSWKDKKQMNPWDIEIA